MGQSFEQDVAASPLGKDSDYTQSYDPSIMIPITRDCDSTTIKASFGEDIWNGYEFYYLNENQLPCTAQLVIRYAANSPNIVESKSLKLYLNTYYKLSFSSKEAAAAQITTDLEAIIQAPVSVSFSESSQFLDFSKFSCLDHFVTERKPYTELRFHSEKTEEVLYTHSFRSLCPVTSQPDFATIIIAYSGQEIDRSSLLHYLISYADHPGFHESCIDTIYSEIIRRKKVDSLTVQGLFTRRGGLDINPCRSTEKHCDALYGRTLRQ